VRDADVADAALPLPVLQRLRVRGDVDQVVHLHQVHLLYAQQAERVLHLPDALLAAAGVDLGGNKEPLAQAELGDEVAGHRFGGAVHGRRVDHIAVEELEHLAQRGACGGVAPYVEGLPGAKPDARQLHAGGGSGARHQGDGADAEEEGAPARFHDFILLPRYTARPAQASETPAATRAAAPSMPKIQPEAASPPR